RRRSSFRRRQRLHVLGGHGESSSARHARVRLRPQQAGYRVVRLQGALGFRARASPLRVFPRALFEHAESEPDQSALRARNPSLATDAALRDAVARSAGSRLSRLKDWTPMCGIYGALALSGSQQRERSTLSAMGDSIVHRGPDDQGTYADAQLLL